jgi:hypothetical protein
LHQLRDRQKSLDLQRCRVVRAAAAETPPPGRKSAVVVVTVAGAPSSLPILSGFDAESLANEAILWFSFDAK